MVWTKFWDMHSGGGTKLSPYEKIYIEAPEAEARVIFYNRFRRNPDRVTCTCCGPDYDVGEYSTLAQASAYHRNCAYEKGAYVERGNKRPHRGNEYQTLDEYLKNPDVLAIWANEIKPVERVGAVPDEGYVWVGG